MGIVGVLLVAAGKGPAGVTILVGLANLHRKQLMAGVAGEGGCRRVLIHRVNICVGSVVARM